MDMDFATSCPLVRPALPRIRFLFVRSRLCSTLPSDGPSRFRPCASLVLHLHQVAQGTFTPGTPGMPGTQDDPAGVAAGGGALRASLTSNSPRAPLRQANNDPIGAYSVANMERIRGRVFKASWPGLSRPSTVVRRIERPQAASRGEKPCVCTLLQRTAPIPNSSLRQGGVDGRDEPGHDDKGSKAQSARTGPTADAISATPSSLISRSAGAGERVADEAIDQLGIADRRSPP